MSVFAERLSAIIRTGSTEKIRSACCNMSSVASIDVLLDYLENVHPSIQGKTGSQTSESRSTDDLVAFFQRSDVVENIDLFVSQTETCLKEQKKRKITASTVQNSFVPFDLQENAEHTSRPDLKLHSFSISSLQKNHSLDVLSDDFWLRSQVNFPSDHCSTTEKSNWVSGRIWHEYSPVICLRDIELDVLNIKAEINADYSGVLSALTDVRHFVSPQVSSSHANWALKATQFEGDADTNIECDRFVVPALKKIQPFLNDSLRTLTHDPRASIGFTKPSMDLLDALLRVSNELLVVSGHPPQGTLHQDPRGDFSMERNVSLEDVMSRCFFRTFCLQEDLGTSVMETIVDLGFAIEHHNRPVADYQMFLKEFEADPVSRIRPSPVGPSP